MTDDELLDYLIIVLYEALLDPGRWREAVELCGNYANHHESSFLMIDNVNNTLINAVVAGIEFSDQVIAGYIDYYCNYHEGLDINSNQDFSYLKSQAQFSIDHDKFYQAFFVNHGAPLLMNTWGDFNLNKHAALFNDHLQRVLFLQKQTVTLHTQIKLADMALDAFNLPILIVDNKGRILRLNEEADLLFKDKQNQLINKAGCLTTSDFLTKSKLKNLIKGATGSAAAGGGMVLNDTKTWQVFVSPLSKENTLALVFIIRPEKAEAILALNLLSKLYNFTSSESKIAAALLSGKSPEEYAQQSGLTISTVRTHIKNLFNKTNTHRQSEFVVLMSQLPPLKVS